MVPESREAWWLAPEALEARSRASFTRCEVAERRPHVVSFWAVFTTPEGEVADRVYRYGEVPPWSRPGCVDEREGLAEWLAHPMRRTR